MRQPNINMPAQSGILSAQDAKTWEVVVGSFVGGSFLTVADILANGNQSVTNRMALIVERFIPSLEPALLATAAFFLMIFLGLGLCFVYKPTTRIGAFTRGSSVIAVLVGMNIGFTTFGSSPAEAAADITLSGQAEIATSEPRPYGPFGIGTLLTGDSSARIQAVTVPGQVVLTCQEVRVVGKQSYCSVPQEQLQNWTLPEQVLGNERVWIVQPQMQQ
jgi:hypothetical protein